MTNYLSYIWEYIIDFAEYILFFYLMNSKAEYKLNINKKLFITLGVILCAVACISISYETNKTTSALEQTNRNESYSPSEYNVAISSNEGYVKIYENRNFEYYYSSSRNIFKFLKIFFFRPFFGAFCPFFRRFSTRFPFFQRDATSKILFREYLLCKKR